MNDFLPNMFTFNTICLKTIKRCLLHVSILCLTILFAMSMYSCSDGDSALLERLDDRIANSEVYDNMKIERIDSLKSLLAKADNPKRNFELNRQLFLEYQSFVCDSALYYINVNIAQARKAGDDYWLAVSLIAKADLVAKAGIFTEALKILQSINSHVLPDDIKDNYYQVCGTTYQYMSEYADGSEYIDGYQAKITAYRDSLLSIPNIDKFAYETEYGSRLLEQGRFDEAIDFFIERIGNHQSGTREYAVIASVLAYAYSLAGDVGNQEYYLVLSAISDIEGSIKENLALRSLAELRFKADDVSHAYYYLRKSMEDANYYSARMRKNQSANILPLVTSAYEAKQKHMQTQLKTLVVAISALVVGLAVAVVFIIKQLRIVSRSLRLVSITKDKLIRLNDELRQTNAALTATNTALTESSCIKEEYIGKFMGLSSNYISTLEKYRKMLYQQAASGNIEGLHKALRSTSIINDVLKEFYHTFDTAFLNIFPDFVAQFNLLFPDGDRIQLKEGEMLNTELRVFALIRLGITDSAKIADFLRCSITTIYTYRSKRKKRALNPAAFDDDVMKIALF